MQALTGVNIQAFQYSGSVNNTVKLASSASPFQFCQVKFQQISVFLFVKNTFIILKTKTKVIKYMSAFVSFLTLMAVGKMGQGEVLERII